MNRYNLFCSQIPHINPVNSFLIHGIFATEHFNEIPGLVKWLHCIQIYAFGNDFPQSFSMYPLPRSKLISLFWYVKDNEKFYSFEYLFFLLKFFPITSVTEMRNEKLMEMREIFFNFSWDQIAQHESRVVIVVVDIQYHSVVFMSKL